MSGDDDSGEEEDEGVPLESEADEAQSRYTIKSKTLSRKMAKNTPSTNGGRAMQKTKNHLTMSPNSSVQEGMS
jgi:hypothetical protein